jgi:hypothetical protein
MGGVCSKYGHRYKYIYKLSAKPEWKKQFGNIVCIHEGNTKTDLNKIECGLDLSGSTWKPVVDS